VSVSTFRVKCEKAPSDVSMHIKCVHAYVNYWRNLSSHEKNML